jgi:hypothetical protein
MTKARMHTVCSHNQSSASWLPVDKQPYDATVFKQRTIHIRSGVSGDSRRTSRRAEQYFI